MDGTFKVGGASCSTVHTVDKMLPRLCLLACRSKWMLFLYVSLIEVFSGLRTMWYKPGWEVENKSSVNGMFFVTSPLLSLSTSLPRPVGAGGARGAMASPYFGRSIIHISIRGVRLCPPHYYRHPRIFRPSYGPDMQRKIGMIYDI